MWKNKGFTLIELLVVVAIIGILASVVLASLNSAREKSRDARRLSDVKQIQTALSLYYDKYGTYPPNTDNDYSGWDTGCYGGNDTFIAPLGTEKFISKTPCDPSTTSLSGGYRYYHYSGGYGCTRSYYVLGIQNMETSGNPYPSSPGWSCPTRNWQDEFDWVVGEFD